MGAADAVAVAVAELVDQRQVKSSHLETHNSVTWIPLETESKEEWAVAGANGLTMNLDVMRRIMLIEALECWQTRIAELDDVCS